MFKKFYSSGGSAHKHRQHTGGHGIQRSAVTDSAGIEDPAQPGGYVLAGPVLGLVYNYNSVHIVHQFN